MSKYEITQSQWLAIMGKSPSYFKGYDLPVESISRYDAILFCNLISKLSGKHFRLPTRLEWEYACRAGTDTAYFFGNDSYYLGQYAWFDENSASGLYSKKMPHSVGEKRPNPWGLYDIYGNVWEWCQDMICGGGWDSHAESCQSISTIKRNSSGYFSYVGFRVILDDE